MKWLSQRSHNPLVQVRLLVETQYNSIMNNVITTETIRGGGGGIKNPDHSDGKIKIGKSPLRRKGSKK